MLGYVVLRYFVLCYLVALCCVVLLCYIMSRSFKLRCILLGVAYCLELTVVSFYFEYVALRCVCILSDCIKSCVPSYC